MVSWISFIAGGLTVFGVMAVVACWSAVWLESLAQEARGDEGP